MIPRSRAIAIVAAACDGAAHLHAAGWIHGDICPGNLIVVPEGRPPGGDRVVLIDLGVSRAAGQAGATILVVALIAARWPILLRYNGDEPAGS